MRDTLPSAQEGMDAYRVALR